MGTSDEYRIVMLTIFEYLINFICCYSNFTARILKKIIIGILDQLYSICNCRQKIKTYILLCDNIKINVSAYLHIIIRATCMNW